MFDMPLNFVAFDLETTGLSIQKDEIIEVGAVKFQLVNRGKGLEAVTSDTFSELIRPENPIPQAASQVNHITDAMVADKRRVEEVLPDFLRFCGSSTILVAHNGHPFDAPFLARVLREKNIPFHKLSVLDSLKLSHAFVSEARSHKLSDLLQLFVQSGASRFRLKKDDLHRATYDCEVLAEVTARLIARAIPEKDIRLDTFAKAMDRAKPGTLISLDAFLSHTRAPEPATRELGLDLF